VTALYFLRAQVPTGSILHVEIENLPCIIEAIALQQSNLRIPASYLLPPLRRRRLASATSLGKRATRQRDGNRDYNWSHH
jgi:hypothetical protein